MSKQKITAHRNGVITQIRKHADGEWYWYDQKFLDKVPASIKIKLSLTDGFDINHVQLISKALGISRYKAAQFLEDNKEEYKAAFSLFEANLHSLNK